MRLTAVLCSAVLLSLCTACGSEPSKTAETTAARTSTAPAVTTAAQTAAPVTTAAQTVPADLEKPAFPQDGDAFLYFTNHDFYLSYDGKSESSPKKPFMCYNPGLAKITGDGKYTVSVTNDTRALRLDCTGDVDGKLDVKGCAFAAVFVKNGTVLYPNMSIEINEIRMDGKPVEMKAKNYTSSDDGAEMRANIYNQWVNAFPDDAHTANGAVKGEFGEYSSQIIDPASIGIWKTIEVDFTVTGCTGAASTAAAGATTSAAASATAAGASTSASGASTSAAASTTAAGASTTAAASTTTAAAQ